MLMRAADDGSAVGFAMNRTIQVLVTQRLRDSAIRFGQEIPRVLESVRAGGSLRALFPPLDAQGDGGLDCKLATE